MPDEFTSLLVRFPPVLQSLVQAELLAGNRLSGGGEGFPAPPGGAYLQLAAPVTTRPRVASAGLIFWENQGPTYGGQFTDVDGRFHVLEPSLSSRVLPHDFLSDAPEVADPPTPSPREPAPTGAVERFRASTIMNYEKWHDGMGYDVEAIQGATPAERTAIERMLLDEPPSDWRDIEALAALDTYRTRQALLRTIDDASDELRVAVLEYAPHLVSEEQRERVLIDAIFATDVYEGLTATLRQVREFHPPAVVDALFKASRSREGTVAVHLVAMLMYLHGKASEPFDMAQRPFFLRFAGTAGPHREAAFRDLCETLGIASTRFD